MSSTELIEQLDPDRDYGERSYNEVVEGVQRGELRLLPGRNLPVLRDAATNHAVKGTGQPLDGDVERWSRRHFNERAAEDFDDVYDAMVRSAKQGDVRAQKLFMEMFLGRPREAREVSSTPLMGLFMEWLSRSHAAAVQVEPAEVTSEMRGRAVRMVLEHEARAPGAEPPPTR